MTEKTPAPCGSDSSTELGLSERLRQRGNDLRCHPLANGTIACTEEAGELLVDAAAEIARLRTALLDANQLCRSAFQIAHRIATEYSTRELGTYFGAFSERVHESLNRQHAVILETGGYLTPEPPNVEVKARP